MDLFENFSNLFVQGLAEIIEHVSNTRESDLTTFGGSVDLPDSENSLQYYTTLFSESRQRQRVRSYRRRNLDAVEIMAQAVQQMMEEIEVTNQNLERVNWKEEGF